jgi:homoserine kinase type II
MGIKTVINLTSLNQRFNKYNFTHLYPTQSGVIDTTYIATTSDKNYILKKYERANSSEIFAHHALLETLTTRGLTVSKLLDVSDDWYLYSYLSGEEPKSIRPAHLQHLARFLAQLHCIPLTKPYPKEFCTQYNIQALLNDTKKAFFPYYKKLHFLANYTMKQDGFIHGDLFKDNCRFDADTIAVFDFIDSGIGSFGFDIAVAFIGFDAMKRQRYNMTLFLNSCNQHAPKKITQKAFLSYLKIASSFYALLRLQRTQNSKQVRSLL